MDEATLKQAVTFGQGTLPGRRSGGKGGGRKHTTLPPSLQDPAGLPQAEPSWRQEGNRAPEFVHRAQPPGAESKEKGGKWIWRNKWKTTRYSPTFVHTERAGLRLTASGSTISARRCYFCFVLLSLYLLLASIMIDDTGFPFTWR